MIVDNLKNNNEMNLNEVFLDVRLSFATEITSYRAYKVRHIVKQIVERDSSK